MSGYPESWDDIESTRNHSAEWKKRKRKVYGQAAELREALRQQMGGRCVKCDAAELLEFHHPRGRTWEPRRCNLRHRMRRYQQDYLRGNLQLLCSTCNGRDGALNKKKYRRKKHK